MDSLSDYVRWMGDFPIAATGFDLWVGKIPWRRKWQPTPVFLPGESHGRRSLKGYSPQGPQGCKESDTTERLHFHFLSDIIIFNLSGTKKPLDEGERGE